MEFNNLIKVLPLHISAWLVMAFLFMVKMDFKDAFYILKGIFWNIANINILIKKRISINRNIRKTEDESFLKKIKSNDSLSDYLRKISSYLAVSL